MDEANIKKQETQISNVNIFFTNAQRGISGQL